MFILTQSLLFCQISEVNLNIDARNLQQKDESYLEELNNDIKFYILSNSFLDTNQDIKIFLDINIVIESISNNNIVNAHVLFSNRDDQILFSDGVEFEYNKGQNLLYSNAYNPLTSFLNYNLFILIASELDKYHYKGGEDYYIKSEDIAFEGTNSEYSRRWNKRLKTVKTIKENNSLRNIKYIYYSIQKYLNNSEEEFDEDIVVESLKNIYDELLNINDDYGSENNTLVFLNSKIEELTELYSDYEMFYVIKFLSQYDKDNIEYYNDFID